MILLFWSEDPLKSRRCMFGAVELFHLLVRKQQKVERVENLVLPPD